MASKLCEQRERNRKTKKRRNGWRRRNEGETRTNTDTSNSTSSSSREALQCKVAHFLLIADPTSLPLNTTNPRNKPLN